MKTIAVETSKGGTGKTTLAVHTAAALAEVGARVVLIDADMQGSATKHLGIPPGPSIYDLLVRGATWQDSLVPVPASTYTPYNTDGALYVVPSNHETRTIASNMRSEAVVAERVRQLRSEFDAVVFDTAPLADVLHSAINASAQHALIVTQCEADSAFEAVPDTVGRLARLREQAASYGLDTCAPLGIIPNMFRTGVALHEDIRDALEEEYGALLWPAVGLRVAVGEASALQRTVFVHAAGAKADVEMRAVTNRVIEAVTTHV